VNEAGPQTALSFTGVEQTLVYATVFTAANRAALFEGIHMLSGTILVAVVDPHVRRTIQDALVAERHCVIEAVGRNDALQSLPDERPDIVLVGFDSEQESCLDFCCEIRRVSDVPIFVFAAQHCERDKVDAIDAGADDYIVKPLAMQEFLARIRAVLRRKSAQREHPIFVSNDLTIDFEQKIVCVACKAMCLTPKEHELLRLLVENQGKPLKHRSLLQAMWGSQCGSQSEHLRVLVCQLRKKVEVNRRYPKFICTDP
jgi:two-component system KDP operon response regulator KdpE